MGQKGTLAPSSWETANARAVFPVPGAPTNNSALPENFRDLMSSTTTPHAFCSMKISLKENNQIHWLTSRAFVWPMNPAPSTDANPSDVKPKPFIWECGAIRDERADGDVGGKGALWAGAEVDVDADVAFIVGVHLSIGKTAGRDRRSGGGNTRCSHVTAQRGLPFTWSLVKIVQHDKDKNRGRRKQKKNRERKTNTNLQ
jgi:hypothetical protein